MDTRQPTTAQNDEAEPAITLLDLAVLIGSNLRLLLLAPLVAGAAALGITFLIAPTYTATARVLPPAQVQSAAAAALAAQLGALAGLAGGAIKTPGDQYVALLKSRTVLNALVERFKLRELYGAALAEDARKGLEQRSRISTGLKDGIISIEVDDTDPTRAASIANAWIEELRNLTNTLAVTEAAQRRLFFEQQLKQAKENLTKSEVALRATGLSEGLLRTVPQSAVEALARLKAQITAQELKLHSMRTFMTDSNPEYRAAQNELVGLRAELTKLEKTGSPQGTNPGTEYVSAYRDFKYHETLFELMAKQFELARLDEAREGTVIQVIDAAQPPERKSKPKRLVIAAITALAVLAGLIIFLLLREGVARILSDPQSAHKLAKLTKRPT